MFRLSSVASSARSKTHGRATVGNNSNRRRMRSNPLYPLPPPTAPSHRTARRLSEEQHRQYWLLYVRVLPVYVYCLLPVATVAIASLGLPVRASSFCCVLLLLLSFRTPHHHGWCWLTIILWIVVARYPSNSYYAAYHIAARTALLGRMSDDHFFRATRTVNRSYYSYSAVLVQ